MVLVLEQFVRSLRESRLMPADEVASLHKALQASKTPRTTEDVAKMLIQSGKLTAYQAATIIQGRPQSLILGEYVLLDILGKGGMGVVFRARHRLMDRVVALKTLSMTAIKPDTVPRFYREVKAAARLSHPNIVTAYDAGEHAGTHYLVMEYVVGRDLAAIVKEKGPLPLRQAIDCVQQAARGLEYAHKHGVVHRDVKPSNLLLDQEGVVKILDMGLARLNENLAGVPVAMEITGAGQILGTIDYMSPEQAEDVHSADHRSDIYSLGCTLFYLLTRRPPYGGETVVKRILAHRDEPIPSVTELRPDCPETLDAAIRQMLAKRPEDRPQGMAEIIVALENCLEKPAAVPPLAGQLPEGSDSARNWLEDLVHEEETPSTDRSQAKNMTLGSPAEDVLHSRPPRSGAGGSSIRRSKQQPHHPGAKKSAPAARGGNTWKIVAAVTAAVVIAVGAAVALILSQSGDDATVASKESAAAGPQTPAASAEDDAGHGGSGAPTANQPIRRSAWDEAWAETKRQADPLVAQRRFARAILAYAALADRFPNPQSQQQCREAIRRIETDAEADFAEVEAVARQHLRQRRFAQARAAVQPALATYGPVPAAGRARRLIEEIDQAQKRASPPAETPAPPKTPAVSVELLKQRQLDATFAKAMAAVEGRVANWDFQGAVQESEKLHFDVPELTARLAHRREQIRRMAALKDRTIAMINQADPPLKKTDLGLRGINGELNKADAEAITATLPNGKRESLVWSELGPKAMSKILPLVVHREDAGDWLAAGLLGLAGQDAPSAERYFDKARSLGAGTAPYMALLATRDLAAVRDLLDKHRYAESESLLITLQEKYGKLPWFTANKSEWDAAAKEAKRGLREKDAEALYAQAAGLFHKGDLYELKPVVERFRAQYADSAVAADAQRKPPLAELEKAVADLGPLLRVRRDGKGDAKTVQEAVNKAAANATIQIEEAGSWSEQIVIPAEKGRLTICGKKGLLPVITSAGAQNSYAEALLVHAPQLSLERLVIARAESAGPAGAAITAETTSLTVRGVVVHGHVLVRELDSQQSVLAAGVRAPRGVFAKDCVFFGRVASAASCSLQNVLVCGPASAGNCGPNSRLRHCTITGALLLTGMSSMVSDSIVHSINALNAGHKIDHCDVFGDNPYMNQATAGPGCLQAPPQFADLRSFDFRLQLGSPCRKAASDGSDMGFAPTPELQVLLKVAADLRNRARGKL